MTLQTDDTLMQLKLAINRAIARQEKRWGYFQIRRLDDGSMGLDIPSLPQIRCVANLDRDIYKLYWGRAEKTGRVQPQKEKDHHRPQNPSNPNPTSLRSDVSTRRTLQRSANQPHYGPDHSRSHCRPCQCPSGQRTRTPRTDD